MPYIYGNEGVTSQPIRGGLYNEYVPIDYTGIGTDTADVIVNNREKTIAVNVNKHEVNKNFNYAQAAAAEIWHIEHNLFRYPFVTCYNKNREQIIGEITYINDKVLEVKFSEAVAGFAYIN